MREFTGAPVVVSPDRRVAAANGLVGLVLAMTHRYRRDLDMSRHPEGSGSFLYLRHREDEEVVLVAEVYSSRGERLETSLGIMALSAGAVVERHRYETERFEDLPCATRNDAPNYAKPVVLPGGALSKDAVTPDEISGLSMYLAQRVDGGLYVPVNYQTALSLLRH